MALAIFLSGCTNPAVSSQEETRGSSVIEAFHTDYLPRSGTSPQAGAIVGVVTDIREVPIQGAHAALIGTDHSRTTNATGHFEFGNLKPGSYFLRVDHPMFHAAESTTQVAANVATPLAVRLSPLPGIVDDDRPHVHDYWEGRTRVEIMNQKMRFHTQSEGGLEGSFQSYTGPAKHVINSSCLAGSEIRTLATSLIRFPDPHQLVWPGTAAIEITFDWQKEDYVLDNLSVVWHGANTREYKASPSFGKGTTYKIAVAPEETDAGHERFTNWEIAACTSEPKRDDEPHQARTTYARPFRGDLHVKVVLVRAPEIPREPAHPNHWLNGSVVEVVNETKEISYSPNQYWLTTARSGRYDFTFLPKEGHIVPPLTTHLEVRLSWWHGGTLRASETTLNERDLSLTYSPGSVAPWNRWKIEDRATPSPAREAANLRIYNITVQPKETDAEYQRLSHWAFYWNFEGEEDQDWAFHQCACPLKVQVRVFAIRDA